MPVPIAGLPALGGIAAPAQERVDLDRRGPLEHAPGTLPGDRLERAVDGLGRQLGGLGIGNRGWCDRFSTGFSTGTIEDMA